MLALRTLLLSLIAVVFAVSGTARAMPAPMAEPPCHEAPATPDKHKPAQLAVNCCVGCMPAPTEAAVVLGVIAAEPTAYAVVQTAIEGRLTAPEPDPPRPWSMLRMLQISGVGARPGGGTAHTSA